MPACELNAPCQKSLITSPPALSPWKGEGCLSCIILPISLLLQPVFPASLNSRGHPSIKSLDGSSHIIIGSTSPEPRENPHMTAPLVCFIWLMHLTQSKSLLLYRYFIKLTSTVNSAMWNYRWWCSCCFADGCKRISGKALRPVADRANVIIWKKNL